MWNNADGTGWTAKPDTRWVKHSKSAPHTPTKRPWLGVPSQAVHRSTTRQDNNFRGLCEPRQEPSLRDCLQRRRTHDTPSVPGGDLLKAAHPRDPAPIMRPHCFGLGAGHKVFFLWQLSSY